MTQNRLIGNEQTRFSFSSQSVIKIVGIHQLTVLVFYGCDSLVECFLKMPESQTLWKSHNWLDVGDSCWNTNAID